MSHHVGRGASLGPRRGLRDTRASPPDHLITHFFCALSRYGVTTVRSFPHADFSVASGMCSNETRPSRAEIPRCLRRMPLLTSSSSGERKNVDACASYLFNDIAHFIPSSKDVATRVSDAPSSAAIMDMRMGPEMSGASLIHTWSYRPRVMKP